MEAAGHEEEVKLETQTQYNQICPAPADLEHAKTAVLNSLASRDAQRGYRHAIDEFVD